MRETKVETYLDQQVCRAGGDTRKWVSPGHAGVPDRLVIWPRVVFTIGKTKKLEADTHYVETKATDGRPKSNQVREHKRLRALGCQVFVINTYELVDAYVKANRG